MYRRNHMQSVGFRTSILAYSDVGVPGCRRADLGVAGVVHSFGSSYSVFCEIKYEQGLLGNFLQEESKPLKPHVDFYVYTY